MDETLRHPKEASYFIACAVLSGLIYAALIFSLFGIIYIVLGLFVAFLIEGSLLGALKGNAVKVGPKQLPTLYQLVQELSVEMEISPPDVYVQQNGGVLNAFASRFLMRNFVVFYSDVVDLAYAQGEAALAFIVAHELGHLKMRHLNKMPWIYPAMLMPFLGSAYSRACEYSADRCAHRYAGQGSPEGLLVLAGGKRLFREMDTAEFIVQAEQAKGFFVWITEKLATHPNLNKRVQALEGLRSAV